MTDQQAYEKFENFAVQMAEMFPDYVIFARGQTNGFMCKASDTTWAIGATQRWLDSVVHSDYLDLKSNKDS